MVYLVTAIRDYYTTNGVEVVGIFDTKEKAHEAKAKVIKWMKDNDYEDSEVFVHPMDINCIRWYGVEESI